MSHKRTILFVLGGKTLNNKPDKHFLLRIEAAITYYRDHHEQEEISFLVSGRWTNVTEQFEVNEAEAGKRYILDQISLATVYKEDVSVELIGNYAFSKPILTALAPDKVVIPTSDLILERNKLIAEKVFADDVSYELIVITHELSDNDILVDKERQAMRSFANLFENVSAGDDTAARNTLLYSTPYYFKGIIDDASFFNRYWEGGFDNYLHGIKVRSNV